VAVAIVDAVADLLGVRPLIVPDRTGAPRHQHISTDRLTDALCSGSRYRLE
jgi:hypothetical protein